ncbi:diguanylate cyclase [Marinobacter sp. HL-58]|uniref:diguanylate cyclase domain-containing protein n=1 Tax=Marinobacter sp. HL-58 TaxID=1479237 RepID=UPI0005605B50|nr:diguanylate cyclase [Marinobacter sp. HL-58]KPP99463.1 MAG: PAS domain S-box/diguanylate cyclase (GGDEF) domain [Marinobacter sp. HL-58]
MRLSDFIRADIEPILQEWDTFAKTLFHAREMDKTGRRDHAREMLLAIADDIESTQTAPGQAPNFRGSEPKSKYDTWAEVHGGDRQVSGFSVNETVSEFRALRDSVVSLWNKASPTIAGQDLQDLTRFHQAVDQAVAESLEQYTTLKEMETRLFGATLLASPDPIYVLDLDGRFIYANKATEDLFTLPISALIGKTPQDLGFPFAPEFQQHLQQVMTHKASYRGEFSHRFSEASGEHFEYLLAPVVDEDGETEATVCISRDITERTQAQEKIWHNAHHDLLTGLPNRRLFLDRLDQEVKHARRRNVPLAVMFMDLDGFKEVNDSIGHEVGDRLLYCVAERLASCVREDDTVARLGGDEFTVILTGARNNEDAAQVAQSIVDALAKPFHIAEPPVHISASIGITFFPRDGSSPDALLKAADHAMYTAKKSATNRICIYEGPEKQ